MSNMGGLILIAIGFVLVILGIKGTQKQLLPEFFGGPSK